MLGCGRHVRVGVEEVIPAPVSHRVVHPQAAVKGLGEWTSHMFLMFQLERPDVLAVGDLGIRRAIERTYALNSLPDAAQIEQLAEPWRPYRTLACRYLWRSLQNEPA